MENKPKKADAAGYTLQPPTLAVPRGFVATASISESEFLRLPKPGTRCPFCSLSRTTICELIERKEIRALRLRRPGASRGVVLIVKSSLAEYLHALANKADSAARGAGKEVSSHE